jgi:hypothetical protein
VPANNEDILTALRVGPLGSEVFVTGWSHDGLTSFIDYATVVYDAITGD